MTQDNTNVSIPQVNLHGQAMFNIEKLKSGAIVVTEYTADGIIKHDFESLLHMEWWAQKYKGISLI